jgi:hypothetical protein
MPEFFLMLAGTIIILITGRVKPTFKGDLFFSWLFVFLCFLTFYWVLGFYEERLTNTLIPIIVCFWILIIGTKITEKKFTLILSSLALTWHLYVLLSYGPFS